MNAELINLTDKLDRARTPEEVFGHAGLPRDEQQGAVRKAYHALARLAHPDAYRSIEEQALAQHTFQKLVEWLALAEELIAAEAYGTPGGEPSKVVLRTRKREYQVEGGYSVDGLYNSYPCQYLVFGRCHPATLKVARDPRDNDLAHNEVSSLQFLRRGRLAKIYSAYFPHLLEAFTYQAGGLSRQALVLEAQGGWYSLEQVRGAYPSGIDPKDMAWIWRRLLIALGFAHLNGFLHRAVLPKNICIHPEQHGLQLRDWTRSINLHADPNRPLTHVEFVYDCWYPDEARMNPSTRTDIVLAAKSMIYLLGGDAQIGYLPHTVPEPIVAFLRGSTLPGKGAPQNAWALKEEFDELLGALWGERKFHPFTMPTQFKPKEVHNG